MELTITKENFDEQVRKAGVPVILDFWATWCGPCQMIAPNIAAIAEELDGKIKVGKVNVDEEPELASAFGIESIPTLVRMENGNVTDALIGYQTKDAIRRAFRL